MKENFYKKWRNAQNSSDHYRNLWLSEKKNHRFCLVAFCIVSVINLLVVAYLIFG